MAILRKLNHLVEIAICIALVMGFHIQRRSVERKPL